MKIQIARNGEVLGEFTREELEENISRGMFDPTDSFWREGMVEWKPLRDLDFYLPKTKAPAVPPPPLPVVQATDIGKHTKKTSSIKTMAVLMIIVGMIVGFAVMPEPGKAPPMLPILISCMLCFVGFCLFIVGRLRQ